MLHMLQHVRELTLSRCNSLVEVFGSGGEGRKEYDGTIHYQLQKLDLYRLPKLCHIWKHNITKVVSFQNLKDIDVNRCHNLKSLFSISMAKSLVQLERLNVSNCDWMEEIITKEDENLKEGNKVKVLFPKLEMMSLHCLPTLECVCLGDYDYDLPQCSVGEDSEINDNNNKVQISFPQLKELLLWGVSKLKCFCSGVYDYNIMVSSTNECPNMTTFPHGNVVVNTPNLDQLQWDTTWNNIQTLGDLNLTIYYLHNSQKYEVQTLELPTQSLYK